MAHLIDYKNIYDESPDMHLSIDPKTGLVIECNRTLLFTPVKDESGNFLYSNAVWRAIADLALDMVGIMPEINRSLDSPIEIRLGVNSGPVVAGVIGKKKFSYDLWGDSVNTAARMESHGLPGEIQVTRSTYDLLQGDYVFETRGEIQIKGKGLMETYLLKGRK